MAKFTFRLTALLRLRESRRDECRAALAEAYRIDDVLRKQIEGFDRELAALREFCRLKSSPGAVEIDQLVEAQRYELVARAQQRHVAQQRETVAAEIERRRQALVEADREVRVLEKLRQRQAEQHRREEDLREVKRLDDVASQQYFRQAQVDSPGQHVPMAVGGGYSAWGPAKAGTTNAFGNAPAEEAIP